MRRRAWLWLALTAAAAAGSVAGDQALQPIPHPDLGRLGEVGAHLAGQVSRLDVALDQPEPSARQLAEAYGELGRLYLAYELWEPGEACLANAAALAAQEPRWSYYLGYLYRRSGDLVRSAELFERTLELRPGYLPALLRLGQVYLQLGRAERIEPLLEQVGGATGEESAVRVLRGRAALAQRDYEAARRHFTAVLAAEPEAGWVHYQLALAYRGLGRLDEARQHLELQTPGSLPLDDPLINELPALTTGAGLYRRRAMAAYEAGQVEQALVELRRALESDPARTDVRSSLALILAESDDLAGAAEQYRQVLGLEPDNLLARQGLGRVLARSGSHAEAVEQYELVIRRQADAIDALTARAGSLEALGRREAALLDHDRLVELEPWNVEHRLGRARFLLRADRLEEAALELAAALTAEPGNALTALDLGGVEARLGRPEAGERFRAVLTVEAAPAIHAAAHFNLGLLASDGGIPEEASEQFRSAAGLRPEWVEAHRRLGESLDREGRYEEAAAAFGAAVALRPDDGATRLGQATCLVSAGQFREAAARLEEGLARFPSSTAFAHALARLLAASPEADLRDGERALELATAVVRAEDSLEHAETLAMALAELGRFEEASGVQAEIIGRAVSGGQPESTLLRLRGNLAGYRGGRPSRLGGAAGRDR